MAFAQIADGDGERRANHGGERDDEAPRRWCVKSEEFFSRVLFESRHYLLTGWRGTVASVRYVHQNMAAHNTALHYTP